MCKSVFIAYGTNLHRMAVHFDTLLYKPALIEYANWSSGYTICMLSCNRYQHKILVVWQIKQWTIQMICNTFENKHVTWEKILTGTPACCAHRNVSVLKHSIKKIKHQCFRNSNDKLELWVFESGENDFFQTNIWPFVFVGNRFTSLNNESNLLNCESEPFFIPRD